MSNPSPLEILFEWGEPFTHQDYPVDNYTVTETDAVMVETTRRTIHTLNYTKTTTAIAQGCRSMRFAIVATSSIGNSNATVIVTGFPIGKVSTDQETHSGNFIFFFIQYQRRSSGTLRRRCGSRVVESQKSLSLSR